MSDGPMECRDDLPCDQCGGWTHNEDGHRNDCPRKVRNVKSDDMDVVMLLVWEAWAKNEGNNGAATLFRDCAERLRATNALRHAAQWIVNDADKWGIVTPGIEALRASLASSLPPSPVPHTPEPT